MENIYLQSIELDKSYIKITIYQSQLFHEDKDILPYTLYLQLGNFEAKKIETINNNLQELKSPLN